MTDTTPAPAELVELPEPVAEAYVAGPHDAELRPALEPYFTADHMHAYAIAYATALAALPPRQHEWIEVADARLPCSWITVCKLCSAEKEQASGPCRGPLHNAASLAAHGRVEVTDAQCNALIAALDQYARDKSAYEYGLPIYHDDAMPAMREVIRKALEEAP